MKVYGIDFTSSPSRRKPLTCLEAEFQDDLLRVGELREWHCFSGFEEFLRCPGPWIAGIDFPFGQSRRFIENIGWPTRWADYVDQKVRPLDRNGFRRVLDNYKGDRDKGDKEHRRVIDKVADALSPQNRRVSWMFSEGAPRLRNAGVMIPGLQSGDSRRVVVEAYPGVLARDLVGPESYKGERAVERERTRRDILGLLLIGECKEIFGIQMDIPECFYNDSIADPSGDKLDAILCALQAAWAWKNRHDNFGLPDPIDPTEGWIAHPFQ